MPGFCPKQKLDIVTPPSVYPVSLAEVKLLAKIEDNDFDTLISDVYIPAAVECVQLYTRRTLNNTQYKQWFDYVPLRPTGVSAFDYYEKRELDLMVAPLQSIVELAYYDTNNQKNIIQNTEYEADTGGGSRIYLNSFADWGTDLREFNALSVEYVAGYGNLAADVPKALKTVVLFKTVQLYESGGTCGCMFDESTKRMMDRYKRYMI